MMIPIEDFCVLPVDIANMAVIVMTYHLELRI